MNKNIFNKKIYFIGIGGISMSALARLAARKGAFCSGSDRRKGEECERLEKEGIKVNYNHKANNVCGVDIVVFSSAICEDNPELRKARELGLLVLSRAEFLQKIAEDFDKVVAISGSHGKTTTTSMSLSVLKSGIDNLTAHIGGICREIDDNLFVSGGGGVFLTEACEYKDNFLSLKPDVGVILNIAADHLDYFKLEENVVRSFIRFSNNIKCGGKLIVNKDDKYFDEIAQKTSKNKEIISFSISDESADYYITKKREEKGRITFSVSGLDGEFFVCGSGEHNLYNALVSIIIGKVLSLGDDKIRLGLSNFVGTQRRFEEVGFINGAKVIFDYAHHPDEIEKVILEAKKIAKGKVFCLFQPHTYSRTKAFWKEFIYALIKADNIMLYPIYSAREKAVCGVSSKRLAYDIRRLKRTCYFARSLDEHFLYLKYFAGDGDIVLVLGAGDIYEFKRFFNNCLTL